MRRSEQSERRMILEGINDAFLEQDQADGESQEGGWENLIQRDHILQELALGDVSFLQHHLRHLTPVERYNFIETPEVLEAVLGGLVQHMKRGNTHEYARALISIERMTSREAPEDILSVGLTEINHIFESVEEIPAFNFERPNSAAGRHAYDELFSQVRRLHPLLSHPTLSKAIEPRVSLLFQLHFERHSRRERYVSEMHNKRVYSTIISRLNAVFKDFPGWDRAIDESTVNLLDDLTHTKTSSDHFGHVLKRANDPIGVMSTLVRKVAQKTATSNYSLGRGIARIQEYVSSNGIAINDVATEEVYIDLVSAAASSKYSVLLDNVGLLERERVFGLSRDDLPDIRKQALKRMIREGQICDLIRVLSSDNAKQYGPCTADDVGEALKAWEVRLQGNDGEMLQDLRMLVQLDKNDIAGVGRLTKEHRETIACVVKKFFAQNHHERDRGNHVYLVLEYVASLSLPISRDDYQQTVEEEVVRFLHSSNSISDVENLVSRFEHVAGKEYKFPRKMQGVLIDAVSRQLFFHNSDRSSLERLTELFERMGLTRDEVRGVVHHGLDRFMFESLSLLKSGSDVEFIQRAEQLTGASFDWNQIDANWAMERLSQKTLISDQKEWLESLQKVLKRHGHAIEGIESLLVPTILHNIGFAIGDFVSMSEKVVDEAIDWCVELGHREQSLNELFDLVTQLPHRSYLFTSQMMDLLKRVHDKYSDFPYAEACAVMQKKLLLEGNYQYAKYLSSMDGFDRSAVQYDAVEVAQVIFGLKDLRPSLTLQELDDFGVDIGLLSYEENKEEIHTLLNSLGHSGAFYDMKEAIERLRLDGEQIAEFEPCFSLAVGIVAREQVLDEFYKKSQEVMVIPSLPGVESAGPKQTQVEDLAAYAKQHGFQLDIRSSLSFVFDTHPDWPNSMNRSGWSPDNAKRDIRLIQLLSEVANDEGFVAHVQDVLERFFKDKILVHKGETLVEGYREMFREVVGTDMDFSNLLGEKFLEAVKAHDIEYVRFLSSIFSRHELTLPQIAQDFLEKVNVLKTALQVFSQSEISLYLGDKKLVESLEGAPSIEIGLQTYLAGLDDAAYRSLRLNQLRLSEGGESQIEEDDADEEFDDDDSGHHDIQENRQRIILDGYNQLLSYLGKEKIQVDRIWRYLGDRNRHDLLQDVPNFLLTVEAVEKLHMDSKRAYVEQFLDRAGMGTGHQARLFSTILSQLSPELWDVLSRVSYYDGHPPCLADPTQLNLGRILNEIKLHQMPEIRESIAAIDSRNPLRPYAMELVSHPNINLDGVKNFVDSPRDFFASRTGAGERQGGSVDMMLTSLAPDEYPGWSAELSRDAIVERTYDGLNAFPAVSVCWPDGGLARKAHAAGAVMREDSSIEERKGAVDFLSEQADRLGGEVSYLYEQLRAGAFLDTALSGEYRSIFLKETEARGRKIATKAAAFEVSQEKNWVLAELLAAIQRLVQKKVKIGTIRSQVRSGKIDDPDVIAKLDEYSQAEQQFQSNQDLREKELIGYLVPPVTVEQVKAFWREIFSTGFAKQAFLGHVMKQWFEVEGFDEATMIASYSAAEGRKTAGDLCSVTSDILGRDSVWYQAEILKPSDPECATAGTSSGSCDAFGHGKKSHFMINPGTAQFVLRRSKGRPHNWETSHIVAQSTVTDTRPFFSIGGKESSGSSLADLREKFFEAIQHDGGKMKQALTEIGAETIDKQIALLDAYGLAEREICLDSVEVTHNIRGVLTPRETAEVLRGAFDRFAKQDGTYDASVTVGTQYSYLELNAGHEQIENKTVWSTPIAYTDNPHTNKEAILLRKKERESYALKKDVAGGFVRPAKPTDAFPIALMEQIAFQRSGGEQYATGFISMANELYGAVLQSEHFGKNPMAFVARDSFGKNREKYYGYLVAFERGSNEIYITDTATTGERRGTGTALILSLMNSVGTDNKLNSKRITMDCRGKTSARALAKESSRRLIEQMSFTDQRGVVTSYRVEGPSLEEVEKWDTDTLIPFSLIPVQI